MNNLNPEEFAREYITAVVEEVPTRGALELNEFYDRVFRRVSARTSFSRNDVLYLHHVFHPVLFLMSSSPLELITSSIKGESYQVRLRNGRIKIDEEVDCVLWENKEWLEAKLLKLRERTI